MNEGNNGKPELQKVDSLPIQPGDRWILIKDVPGTGINFFMSADVDRDKALSLIGTALFAFGNIFPSERSRIAVPNLHLKI